MKINTKRFRRLAYGTLALALGLVGSLPVLDSRASAAGQVQTRSIQLSNSTASAAATSYLVTFTPATSGAQSLVIDFCQNSAIIGGTCTTTNGVSASSVGFTAGTGTTNWTLGTTAASTVKLTKNTGSALSTSAVSFTLTNITNPTVTGSFYARIYTYSDTTYGSSGTAYSSPTAIGTNVDYGGFALSIANNVTISATVMETLTFCVSKAAPGSGCSGTTTPTLTIGHGSPLTIDSSAVDTDTAYTQLSTNANSGATVNLKVTSSTTCAGLSRDNGATCTGIPAKGAFGPIVAGTANFGLNVANGTGGTGTVTANGNYGTTAGSYGMANATFGTYGDPIEASTAATANVNSLLTYGATAATTTPAGVYTATHALIATGVF